MVGFDLGLISVKRLTVQCEKEGILLVKQERWGKNAVYPGIEEVGRCE